MDYWDPYGLDEGLLGSITMGVPTSTPPKAPPLVRATLDVIAGPPPDTATFTTPPGILSLVPLYVEGNAPPLFGNIWTPLTG
uniref:Uncharacterized protein n=1 Tax=Timema poppense TaxID=170557 RepID=A0A7R9DVJ0_TIMPO|nr:unnamed protein product [Timema poppensis]